MVLLWGSTHCFRPFEAQLAKGADAKLPGERPSRQGNGSPRAQALELELSEDTSVSFSLEASDAGGDARVYAIVTGPRHGTLFGTPPHLTYTPDVDFHGTDRFTFTASDSASAPATVVITVKPVNDLPVAEAQAVTTREDSPVTFTLAASDGDGDSLRLVLTVPPSHGTVAGTPPRLTYTPDPAFHGTDRFSYRASDGRLSSREVTVSLTVAPVKKVPLARSLARPVVQGRGSGKGALRRPGPSVD